MKTITKNSIAGVSCHTWISDNYLDQYAAESFKKDQRLLEIELSKFLFKFANKNNMIPEKDDKICIFHPKGKPRKDDNAIRSEEFLVTDIEGDFPKKSSNDVRPVIRIYLKYIGWAMQSEF